MSEGTFEREYAVTLVLTDRGREPKDEELREVLLEAASGWAAEGIDLTDVFVDKLA